MAQQRHHYERAFESYLRSRRIPYVSVDEARKSLIADDSRDAEVNTAALKSFDFVVYGAGFNLLVDVKGRQSSSSPRRLESWVTNEDIESLRIWQRLFGSGFKAAFVFMYGSAHQPPDGLFADVFEFRARWYALRSILIDDYTQSMKQRSPRWQTVNLAPADFDRLSVSFSEAQSGVIRRKPRARPGARESEFDLRRNRKTVRAEWALQGVSPAHRVLP